jgi:site-specific DNA-cytosine methylase
VNHTFTAFHMACGSGVGARGFNEAVARLGGDVARFQCVGGIDNDPEACEDFELLAGVPALLGDLHTLTPAEIRRYSRLCGLREGLPPDVVFSSSPCKGYSRLLPTAKSKEPKYQLLNELVYRSIFLALETWERPPPLIVLENVPGIVSRGKDVLDRVKKIYAAYGYVWHESFHDCGEIGNLAQHRKRYLLVARHPESVDAFVHKPPKHRVRACGQVLEQLPVPASPEAADAGVMHALPKLGWLTQVRLALIPAGGDWRDLPPQVSLGVDATTFNGSPGLYRVVGADEPFPTVTGSARVSGSNGAAAVADPRVGANNGVLGVTAWSKATGVIAGASRPSNGRFAVADPRLATPLKLGQSRRELHAKYDMRPWSEPARVVAGGGTNGGFGVADPRLIGVAHRETRFHDQYKVRAWQQPAGVVTGATDSQAGAQHVADPRPRLGRSGTKPRFNNNMRVGQWERPSLCVTSAARPDSGGVSVADPRPHAPYRNGQLGVVSWREAVASITGSADVQNGAFAVADPRKPLEQLVIIIAEDGTWHRAITTLELALLQSLPARINGKPLVLAGTSTGGWRERIGNAVPADAAKAIANSCALALLAAKTGAWQLSLDGVWVRERDHFAMPAEEAYA